jgi:hypothetical protein
MLHRRRSPPSASLRHSAIPPFRHPTTSVRRLNAGLCDTCTHQKLIRNTRGSTFSMCERSKDEPERYPKYPRVPVTACAGYDRRPTGPRPR